MKEQDWILFKKVTEKKFQSQKLQSCWGFQIQKNTKWNVGLSLAQITDLELSLGLKFPFDYIEMLKVLNGFETLQISIDPEGENEDEFERRCYKYPDDIEKTRWLVQDVNENIKYANKTLEEAGFDPTEVEGFIPLYGHRALVVLKNKEHSPVLSIWGDDIILYGESLIKYWCHEFSLRNFNV
jgi:hypothetical protein